MSYPKQPEEDKKYAVCGSVVIRTKKLLLQEATHREITLAKFVGNILNGWAQERELVYKPDERQYTLFSRNQTTVESHTTLYREGALGKELKKTHHKRVE
jgi:hypothetical protein